MGIDFGSWGGRTHVKGDDIARWDETHKGIMNFLSRHVVSRTIE